MRATKAELEALVAAVDLFESEGLPPATALRSLLTKFSAKSKTTGEVGEGLAPGTIEFTLVKYGGDKVIPITGARDLFWIKQYQTWRGLRPTLEQVELVARWLSKQNWLTNPLTISDVAAKWPVYLAKASTSKVPVPVKRREFIGEG